MPKDSKPFGQGISNFLFQILFDSTLEFQFTFLSCWTIRHFQFENALYETRINIIKSCENFNTQTTIVGNIHGVFS